VTAFRLALVNPNTEPAGGEAMAAVAGAALGAEAEVTSLTAARGPRSIESAADAAIAAAQVAELVRDHPGHDAYLIACFNDPGLDAARELTSAPVVGIGEAAFRAVLLVARRFAVITTLPRGIPDLEEQMERLGVRARCAGVLPLNIPVSEQGGAFPATTEAIVTAGREAVRRLGAEALVLACGGMSDAEAALREHVGVPAVNGVAFGALLAHALWRAGLRTSAAGSLAAPEPIPYAGMPAFTPGGPTVITATGAQTVVSPADPPVRRVR
jgi:allantoin racemase